MRRMSFAMGLDNSWPQYLSTRAANKSGPVPLSTSSFANVEATPRLRTETQWSIDRSSNETVNSLAPAQGRTNFDDKCCAKASAFERLSCNHSLPTFNAGICEVWAFFCMISFVIFHNDLEPRYSFASLSRMRTMYFVYSSKMMALHSLVLAAKASGPVLAFLARIASTHRLFNHGCVDLRSHNSRSGTCWRSIANKLTGERNVLPN